METTIVRTNNHCSVQMRLACHCRSLKQSVGLRLLCMYILQHIHVCMSIWLLTLRELIKLTVSVVYFRAK